MEEEEFVHKEDKVNYFLAKFRNKFLVDEVKIYKVCFLLVAARDPKAPPIT